MNFHPNKGYRCYYVRDRHSHAQGLIMTYSAEGVTKMGWSLCNRKEDVFRKQEARKVAFERMTSIPQVELPKGLHNTPMNRAFVALANDTQIPQTIRSAVKNEIENRVSKTIFQRKPTTKSEELTFFQRLRRFFKF